MTSLLQAFAASVPPAWNYPSLLPVFTLEALTPGSLCLLSWEPSATAPLCPLPAFPHYTITARVTAP